MEEKVSFKKILLNKKNKDTIRDLSKKENPKIPKTRSAKIRNVSNKVKKENRLINNNPRLNSFRTFIQNNIIPKIKKNKKSYTSKPSFKK